MKYLLFLCYLAISITSCSKNEFINRPICDTVDLDDSKDYNSVINELDEDLLLRAVEEPSDSGALGRNKNGYFHVRFQLSMSKLTDLAIASQRTDALEGFLKNLEYSFLYQEDDGGFELRPPQDLLDNPDIPPASEGDRVSAVAFFAYSLGLSLTSLENSDWYTNSSQTAQFRSRIQTFDADIASMIDYLKTNESILYQTDQNAPNRLLFNAIALYSLGTYLSDQEAKAMGLGFMQASFQLVDSTSGFFIEGGGWDSSYNGVALKLGLEMYSMLNISEVKETLGQILVCAMDWQLTRILPDGEISTEGNSRVFPGGESFLGNEKTVDAEKTIMALFYFGSLTGDRSYGNVARRVLEFYE